MDNISVGDIKMQNLKAYRYYKALSKLILQYPNCDCICRVDALLRKEIRRTNVMLMKMTTFSH